MQDFKTWKDQTADFQCNFLFAQLFLRRKEKGNEVLGFFRKLNEFNLLCFVILTALWFSFKNKYDFIHQFHKL